MGFDWGNSDLKDGGWLPKEHAKDDILVAAMVTQFVGILNPGKLWAPGRWISSDTAESPAAFQVRTASFCLVISLRMQDEGLSKALRNWQKARHTWDKLGAAVWDVRVDTMKMEDVVGLEVSSLEGCEEPGKSHKVHSFRKVIYCDE